MVPADTQEISAGVIADPEPGIASPEQQPSPAEGDMAATAEGTRSDETSEADELGTEEGNEDDADARAADLQERLKGIDKDTLNALLEMVDPEVRDALPVLQEHERRGEQRALTQKQEAEQAIAQREEAFTVIAKQGVAAATWLDGRISALERAARDGDEIELADIAKTLKPEALRQAMIDFRAGGITAMALEQARRLDALRDKHADVLRSLSEDEEAALKKARYQDARQGSMTELETLVELLVEKAKVVGEERGTKKAEKKANVDARTLERLERLAELASSAPPMLNGKGPARPRHARDQLREEMNAIDVTTPAGRDEWERRQPEFKRRLAALNE